MKTKESEKEMKAYHKSIILQSAPSWSLKCVFIDEWAFVANSHSLHLKLKVRSWWWGNWKSTNRTVWSPYVWSSRGSSCSCACASGHSSRTENGFCKLWVEFDEFYLVADLALEREDDLLAIELRVHVVLKWRSTFFGNVFEIVRNPIKISWNVPTLTSPCLRSLLLVGIGAPELSFSRISLDRKSCTVCIGVLL